MNKTLLLKIGAGVITSSALFLFSGCGNTENTQSQEIVVTEEQALQINELSQQLIESINNTDLTLLMSIIDSSTYNQYRDIEEEEQAILVDTLQAIKEQLALLSPEKWNEELVVSAITNESSEPFYGTFNWACQEIELETALLFTREGERLLLQDGVNQLNNLLIELKQLNNTLEVV